MNEILLYGAIDENVAANLIYSLNWIGENQVYSMRMYSPGGDVEASWGIVAKMQELKIRGCHSIAKVDGMAMSMASVLLCFFDEREALEVSNLMIHRASFDSTDEDGNPIILSPEDKAYLAKINTDLKDKLSQIIDNTQLKKIKGITINDLFDESKDPIDCILTAKEAQQIGLITKVIPLDVNATKNMAKAAMACYYPARPTATAAKAGHKINNTKMTAEELKLQNPDLFKSIQDEAAANAIKAYKAKNKKKADPEEDPDEVDPDDDDPDDDEKCKSKAKAKAKREAKLISDTVEKTLQAVGLARIEGSSNIQTATATAVQTATAASKAEADKKAKDEADQKAINDLKSDILKIKTGK